MSSCRKHMRWLVDTRILTRLARCTLWSTNILENWHSKDVLYATSRRSFLQSSEVIVKQHCCPTTFWGHCCIFVIRGHCFIAVCSNSDLGPHCCEIMTLIMRVACLLKTATDRHGRTYKVFFAHPRAWRTPRKGLWQTDDKHVNIVEVSQESWDTFRIASSGVLLSSLRWTFGFHTHSRCLNNNYTSQQGFGNMIGK
jgi:hypothetical protein